MATNYNKYLLSLGHDTLEMLDLLNKFEELIKIALKRVWR